MSLTSQEQRLLHGIEVALVAESSELAESASPCERVRWAAPVFTVLDDALFLFGLAAGLPAVAVAGHRHTAVSGRWRPASDRRQDAAWPAATGSGRWVGSSPSDTPTLAADAQSRKPPVSPSATTVRGASAISLYLPSHPGADMAQLSYPNSSDESTTSDPARQPGDLASIPLQSDAPLLVTGSRPAAGQGLLPSFAGLPERDLDGVLDQAVDAGRVRDRCTGRHRRFGGGRRRPRGHRRGTERRYPRRTPGMGQQSGARRRRPGERPNLRQSGRRSHRRSERGDLLP